MRVHSTRGKDGRSLPSAIIQGLASDGGLFVPDGIPSIEWQAFAAIKTLDAFAHRLLSAYFQESDWQPSKELCASVFSFPMPLRALNASWHSLELFHGPTLSFKDFGARFFAACLSALSATKPRTVLVATSGDTGSAVASAVYQQPNLQAYVLFPKGKISQRQQQQITCWGDNVHAVEVEGTFDDCQRLVKEAFADSRFAKFHLTTANSINIARLLPQQIFYAYSSVQRATALQKPIHYIIPSGNLGNATACYWARAMGFPIGQIRIACNANDSVNQYLDSGVYTPKASIQTLANAMDVGAPSNLERLQHLFPDFADFRAQVNSGCVSDREIKSAIVKAYKDYGYLMCPHSATAFHRLQDCSLEEPWVMVATAAPAKFEQVLEPLLGETLAVPDALQQLLVAEHHSDTISAQLSALLHLLDRY